MEIFIIIFMAAFMSTVIMKIDEQHFNEGFDDCIKHYQDKRILIPYDEPRDSYERGWNCAINSIEKNVGKKIG